MIAFIKSLGGEGETYILYCYTNGHVYDCIREIDLLLSNETCFNSQITFTYNLPVLSHGSNCKRLQTTFNSICARQSLLITYTMMAIFLIMTSKFVIADMVHRLGGYSLNCAYLKDVFQNTNTTKIVLT